MPKEKAKRQHMLYAQKFRKEWLQLPDFQPWLSEIPGNPTKALCKFCQRHLNARMNDLKKHSQCKKHLLVSERLLGSEALQKSNVVSEASDDEMDIPSERFLKILRDISSMEDYKIAGNQSSIYENGCSDTGRLSQDGVTKFAKVQSETNTLLHALINVQKERMAVEKERLDTEKVRLGVEERILSVLNNKIIPAAAAE